MSRFRNKVSLLLDKKVYERLVAHAKFAKTTPATLVDRLLMNAEGVRANVEGRL